MPRHKYHIPQTLTFKQPDGTLNVFIRNEELGHGSFSIVYRVTHQNTNKIYAMKVISKKRYSKSKDGVQDLQNEVEIQKMVKHPNIISSDFSFTDRRNQYLILEYCPGRTIREYLYRSSDNRLREPEVRKVLKDVIQGLDYIHCHGITHYDIKLENFIIDSSGNIKIGDFGLSNFHKNEVGKRFSIFGTINYLSPEMLAKKSRNESYKVDIWAVGVSAFYMLTGKHPFEGSTKEIIFRKILNGDFSFPANLPISKEASDFVLTVLQTNPRKRPSAKELLSHPFLTKVDYEAVCLYEQSNLPQLNAMQKTENEKNGADKEAIDNKPLQPRLPETYLKKHLCPPLNDNKPFSPRPTTNANKPLCQPLNDNKPLSTRPTTNAKPPLCSPLSGNKPLSPRPTTNVNKPLCPPLNENKPMPPKPPTANLKPPLCPPLNNNKPISPRPITTYLKQPLCPPLKENKPNSPLPPTANSNPPLCPPLNENKQLSPRPTLSPNKPMPPAASIKPPSCRPLDKNKPVSPRPPTANLNASNWGTNRPISPKIQTNGLTQAFCRPSEDCIPISASLSARSPCKSINQAPVINFIIPNHFISRYCFFDDYLGYLLLDGTVGICFGDNTRVVMDPYEQFVQYYKDEDTPYPDIIHLHCNSNENEPEVVSLVRKAANYFKRIRFSYELPEFKYESIVVLHNIKRFVKNDESILFKLDDMNFQVIFNDSSKLIIFWKAKKLCFFKSMKEKCALLDVKSVTGMNSNSDELMKFKKAKVLLSNLSHTIC